MSDSGVTDGIGKMSVGGDSNRVLREVTAASVNKPVKDNETALRAKEHGWAKPVEFDYKKYVDDKVNEAMNGEGTATTGADKTGGAAARADAAGGAVNYTSDIPDWASNAAKYEWKQEYGDVAPRHKELEEQLFRNEFQPVVGEQLSVLNRINVTVESEAKVNPVLKFEDAGLHPVMLDNIKLCKYTSPTAIQCYCIPAILTNRDIIAVAQTGSGKTAAFLIPVLSKLMGKAKKLCGPRATVFGPDFDLRIHGVRAEPLVLIIAPTRELACQIFDETRRLCYRSMLRPCVAYGGAPTREQIVELQRGCDILIATPGRLIDFMENKGHVLSLQRVKYTIIDEADEMVSPDWMDDMRKILYGGDNNEDADHRYMLFSATFPKEARQLAKEYLEDDHIRIRVGRVGSTHALITQKLIFAEDAAKRTCLVDLLMSVPPARTIIFVNSKKSADFLDDFLHNKGLPCTSIHSDRTQREREDALRSFKSGRAPILVATGVSARGLDIIHVMHVINYDLPSSEHGGIQEYVHRIGRTARIGNHGIATSLYNEHNEDIAPALTKLLMETGQIIPDFLEQFKPELEEGQAIDFEDESDEEVEGDDDDGEGGGGGWGDDTPAEDATAEDEAPGWEPTVKEEAPAIDDDAW